MWEKIEAADGKSYLLKEFKFKNFTSAFAFMTQVAFLAEKNNHHPNWNNVYNRVIIKLNTHDQGDIISEKDINLAAAIDQLL
jgi:4a-hydroxytetrahydrobiopterin dehydratase